MHYFNNLCKSTLFWKKYLKKVLYINKKCNICKIQLHNILHFMSGV